MTVAHPDETTLPSEDEREERSDVHHKPPQPPEEKEPERTYQEGDEINSGDMERGIIRSQSLPSEKGEPPINIRDVKLIDGREARVELVSDDRFRILELWEAGQDPHMID